MIAFCPTCANMLLVQVTDINKDLRYYCQTCPYVYNVVAKVTKKTVLKRKEVDDVLGGPESFKNAAKTQDARCPECAHDQAYFMELQTRSADEPATVFYQCCECTFRWKEG